MKNIPWKSIAFGCGTLALMVLFRCVVTAGRYMYYGGIFWQNEIMADPWFYIGMVAAAVCVAALLVLGDRSDKEKKKKATNDGCEE